MINLSFLQVASKINSLQILRRFEERLLKLIEEEEIKSMRREMVPKAQLMPIFNKPFFPQRCPKLVAFKK